MLNYFIFDSFLFSLVLCKESDYLLTYPDVTRHKLNFKVRQEKNWGILNDSIFGKNDEFPRILVASVP